MGAQARATGLGNGGGDNWGAPEIALGKAVIGAALNYVICICQLRHLYLSRKVLPDQQTTRGGPLAQGKSRGSELSQPVREQQVI